MALCNSEQDDQSQPSLRDQSRPINAQDVIEANEEAARRQAADQAEKKKKDPMSPSRPGQINAEGDDRALFL